jgi:hypothetical protein
MECATVKIESPVSEDNPTGYIVINAEDFKEGEHVLFEGPDHQAAPVPNRDDLDKVLRDLPGTGSNKQTDPDYAVNSLRAHFGELFNANDEVMVRELVKPSTQKASEGLTVAQIKDALSAKNIEIPDGVHLKADLANLLDESV